MIKVTTNSLSMLAVLFPIFQRLQEVNTRLSGFAEGKLHFEFQVPLK